MNADNRLSDDDARQLSSPAAGFGFDRSRLVAMLPRASIVVLLVVVAVVGALMTRQWQSFADARAQVEQTLSMIERSRALAVKMVDAETGQRGFIITRDPRFLEPYREAIEAAPGILATLTTMAAGRQSQLTRLNRIDELWRARAEKLREAIDHVQQGRMTDARDVVALGSGKNLMDSLRTEIDQVVGSEQRLLSRRLAAADEAEAATRWAIVTTLVVAAIALLLALYSVLHDNRKLTTRVESERQASAALEQTRAQLAFAVSQTQSQLDDTSRLLAAAVASAPIFVWNQDKNLVYRWFSGRPLGRAPEEFIGRSDDDVLPERIKSTVVSNNMAVIESGQPRSYEISLTNKAGEIFWYDIRLEPTRDATGAVDGLTGVAIEITERKKREQNIRLLMREIAHRSKNILAVVQAMARQTATTTPEPKAFVERFAARLEALGATHSLLVDDGWTGADIGDLIRSQIGHQLDQLDKQVFLSGPSIRLPSDVSQNIGLALHELATNAAKYGALSAPDGRVDITWSVADPIDGKRGMTLRWLESNGPPVTPPKRKGFGQVVIERTVSRALGGAVDINYAPTGFSWTLTFSIPDDPDSLTRSA